MLFWLYLDLLQHVRYIPDISHDKLYSFSLYFPSFLHSFITLTLSYFIFLSCIFRNSLLFSSHKFSIPICHTLFFLVFTVCLINTVSHFLFWVWVFGYLIISFLSQICFPFLPFSVLFPGCILLSFLMLIISFFGLSSSLSFIHFIAISLTCISLLLFVYLLLRAVAPLPNNVLLFRHPVFVFCIIVTLQVCFCFYLQLGISFFLVIPPPPMFITFISSVYLFVSFSYISFLAFTVFFCFLSSIVI